MYHHTHRDTNLLANKSTLQVYLTGSPFLGTDWDSCLVNCLLVLPPGCAKLKCVKYYNYACSLFFCNTLYGFNTESVNTHNKSVFKIYIWNLLQKYWAIKICHVEAWKQETSIVIIYNQVYQLLNKMVTSFSTILSTKYIQREQMLGMKATEHIWQGGPGGMQSYFKPVIKSLVLCSSCPR